MKSESIIKGVSIGISTAILWSIVLNSKVVGIGVGISSLLQAVNSKELNTNHLILITIVLKYFPNLGIHSKSQFHMPIQI